MTDASHEMGAPSSSPRLGVVLYCAPDRRFGQLDRLHAWVADKGLLSVALADTWIAAVDTAREYGVPVAAVNLRDLSPIQIDKGLGRLAGAGLTCLTVDDGVLTAGAGDRYVRTGVLRDPAVQEAPVDARRASLGPGTATAGRQQSIES